MIVVDASAAVAALLRDDMARQRISHDALHIPHLADIEIISTLRRLSLTGRLPDRDAETALAVWRQFGLTRYPAGPLMRRVWELRHVLSAYDAGYVALAEALGCPLLTADARLSRANGLRCEVAVVPG